MPNIDNLVIEHKESVLTERKTNNFNINETDNIYYSYEDDVNVIKEDFKTENNKK